MRMQAGTSGEGEEAGAAEAEDPRACATGKLRLFVGDPLGEGGVIDLAPAAAHHVLTVMRRQAGALVHLFNGREGEWCGRLEPAGRRGARVHLLRQTRPQDGVPDLVLLFAPVKRARLGVMIEKATELGVSALRPVITRRTVVARIREERLAAHAIEAAEQCGRLTVPALLEAIPLARVPAECAGRRILFCDEGGREAPPLLDVLRALPPGPLGVLVGPEGGFAPEERLALRAAAGLHPATLGPRVLRADTAALAALALVQAVRGDLAIPPS